MSKLFWEKWIKSNELEQAEQTEELFDKVFYKTLGKITWAEKHSLCRIINSYFVDLTNYIQGKTK